MTNRQKGLDFENQCFDKLKEIGFTDLSLTQNTDNGADIIGTYNGTRYVFQCKDHKKLQGNRCVQEVISAQKLYRGNRSVVISSSPFTSAAVALAKANNCILIVASDFFDLSNFPPPDYSAIFVENTLVYNFEYDIVERYEEIKRALGRTPKWEELNKNLKYRIRKNYKNYTNFLDTIGDKKQSSKATADELKREYIRIRNLLNRVPTSEDIKANTCLPYNQFHAYPLTKLQKECGDRPHVERGVSKDELKQAYFALEKKLGHPPAIKEIDELGEYRSSYYARRWGNFDGFLLEIGRTRTQAGLPRVYTKDEVVLVYALTKMLLSVVNECSSFNVNHTVFEKLKIGEKAIISPSTISKKFGSWGNFSAYIENSAIDTHLENLVEEIRQNGLDKLLGDKK